MQDVLLDDKYIDKVEIAVDSLDEVMEHALISTIKESLVKVSVM